MNNIFTRVSIRKFQDRPVEIEKIKEEMDNKGWYNRHDREQFAEIVDKRIKELKGEEYEPDDWDSLANAERDH